MAELKMTHFEALKAPFPANMIGTLPKPFKKDSPKSRCNECGGYHGMPAVHLHYVGHAAVTERILNVDPNWSWEPLTFDDNGLPLFDQDGGLWIKLTIVGVTRLGYGDSGGKRGANATKESIGDAIRNAAMRFGVALDLWHKGDLLDYKFNIGDEIPTDDNKEVIEQQGYSQEEFDRLFPSWEAMIKDGKKTADQILQTLKKRGAILSEQQMQLIKNAGDE